MNGKDTTKPVMEMGSADEESNEDGYSEDTDMKFAGIEELERHSQKDLNVNDKKDSKLESRKSETSSTKKKVLNNDDERQGQDSEENDTVGEIDNPSNNLGGGTQMVSDEQDQMEIDYNS